MGVTIDTISIEIESSSIGAAKGIDALAKSLEGLKKNGSFKTVSTNLNNLSDALDKLPNVHRAANALRTLANSIEKLKGVGTVAGLSNSLAKLPAALAGIGKIDLDAVAPQIEKVVAAVAPLSTIKAGGLNTMMNSLKKLGEVTKSLDTETINAFAEKVALLTSKLGPLSEKMSTIKAGFSAINSGARSAASGVDQLDSEIDASALNMSSFITIIQAVAGALQAAIQKFSEFISQAIEWDGIAARFGRSFGAEAEETYAWIQRLNEEMGINVQQFMQYSSLYAQMLTGFGVAGEDASKMALGYTELTYDIWASANDRYKSFEDAAEAVASAIAGEVEPIRRAGFTIVEATLAETAAYHGLDISLANATEAQKSYLRYLTLVDQAHSTGTIGVYAKELNTAEGMMRTFNQQLKSLAQAFGSLFLPILVKVMPYLQAFVELLAEGVRWIAGLFGVEIQDIGDTWKQYEAGAGAVDKVTDSANGATGALDDATKAAKELKNATLGIDELNVISPQSASGAGGGAGGGGSGGVGGGGGFEGLDIDSLWDETIFDNIQSDVDAIKEKMRGWMPVIAGIATAFAGLRLLNLLDDLGVIEKSKLFSGGLKIDLSGLKEFTGWIKAFTELVKEGGLIAALGAAFPKISAWIAGLPAALSSASAALAAAAPYIGIAAAIVAGITLALVDYDFTDIGYKVGEKIGSALKAGWEFIRDGAIAAFEWAVDALEIDDFWDVLAILFIPGEWFRRLQPEITELFNNISDWINGKIENLKGNINEFFDGFFDGLFDGLGIDMSWAEKFTDIFDIEYLDIVEFIVNPFSIGQNIMDGIIEGIKSGDFFGSIKEKFTAFVDKIKEFFGIKSPSTLMRDQIGKNLVEGIVSGMSLSGIKDKLSSMWDTAKTWWDNKKEGLASYTPSIGSISTKLSSAWESAKTWWKDKKSGLASYTPSIGSIYDKLKTRWDNARIWWNDKKTKAKEYTPSIGSIYDKLSTRWKNARDWWNSKKGSLSYTPSIGSIKDKIVSAWNSAKKWWSSNAKLSTKLNISVPKLTVNWGEVSALGKTFKYPKSFSVKFAAKGGIFDQGSLIWAGERGPEIMAEASGGRTGVMNVQQMQDAVYEGVYAAVSAAMRGMNGGGNGQEVRVFLDGKEISSSVKKHQHESGATIMGNEVYAY